MGIMLFRFDILCVGLMLKIFWFVVGYIMFLSVIEVKDDNIRSNVVKNIFVVCINRVI